MLKLKINKLYIMDCFKFLKLIPNEFIDLIVIDPPYNMNKDKWDRFNSTEEFFKFTYSYLDMLIPKMKNTGSFYIFNSPFNCAFILKYIIDKGLIFQNWITWDKRDGLSAAKKKIYKRTRNNIIFHKISNLYI